MKISIVTPSYNQAQFLPITIQSVLSQVGDFQLEYIIIDGASTDGSVDIIKQYASRDKRIQWLSEPDNGQSHAINKGLHMATGDIVAYLNSDDIYQPGALQSATQAFEHNPEANWLYGKCTIINEHGTEIRKAITKYKNMLLRRYSYNKLLVVNYISQPAVFWKKELLATVGYINEAEHLVMDYEYWCRLGKEHAPFVLPQYLAGFRSYATNKSSQGFVEQFKRETEVAAQYSSSGVINALHVIHAGLIIALYKVMN